MRHPLLCCGLLLGAALSPLPAPAQSAVPPDAAQVRAGLDIGTATLTGRPRASRAKLSEAGKRRWGRPAVEHVYAQNQAVHLIPYTPQVEALVMQMKGDPFLVMASMGDAGRYSATAITNAEGRFRFRALQPGRYLLLTTVPYQAAVTYRDDTGMTRTETTMEFEGDNLVDASSVTSPVYSYRNGVTDLEHRVFKVVDVRADQAVTELGDLE